MLDGFLTSKSAAAGTTPVAMHPLHPVETTLPATSQPDYGQMLSPADFDDDGTLDLIGDSPRLHESVGEPAPAR